MSGQRRETTPDKGLLLNVNQETMQFSRTPRGNSVYPQHVQRARSHEHTHARAYNNKHSLSTSNTNIHHVAEEGWHLLPLNTFPSFSHPFFSQTLSQQDLHLHVS